MKSKNLLKILMLTALMSGCGSNTNSSTNSNTISNSVNTSESTSTSVVTSSTNSTSSSSTSIKEEVKVLGVEVNSENNVSSIKEEETLQLTAVVYPENADQSVTWSSEDNLVATVSETGLVTGVSRGQVIIYATSNADSNIVGEFYLTVEEKPVEVIAPESISLTSLSGETTLKTSETLELVATVLPEGANPQVRWSTSNASVAKVDRGVVTGISAGTVEISATSVEDANVSASITLTVEQGDVPVSGEWANVAYTSHDDYMNAEDGTKIKVKGIVTHVLPVDEGKNTVSYYIQNGTEGFYVYAQDSISFNVEEGKVYEVGGFKKYYFRGQHEIVDVEHFIELDETITYTTVSLNDKDVSSKEVTDTYHGAYVSADAVATSKPEVGDKTYTFGVQINGKSINVCVDRSAVSAEELKAINAKFENVVSGTTMSIKGIMSAYGYGTPAPQISIVSADDLVVEEATDQQIVDNALSAFTVPSSISLDVNKIDLLTSIEGKENIDVKWESSNTTIISNAGDVTHPSKDTTVDLTVTLTLNEASASKKFSVTVFGTDSDYQVVHTLDFEDSLEANNNGNSLSKPGYSPAATISAGTPKANWYINNGLIGAITNDKRNGEWSLRLQSNNQSKEASGRLELQENYEFNAIEFNIARYGNDAVFEFVIEYSLDDGSTWLTLDTVYTVENTALEVYKAQLPEGTDRVAIQMLQSESRKRANIDDVKLLK